MPLRPPSPVRGLFGVGGGGVAGAPAFTRTALTGKALTGPAFSVPAVGTICAVLDPTAADSNRGAILGCWTGTDVGLVLRIKPGATDQLEVLLQDSATKAAVQAVFPSAGLVGGGKVLCWGRWGHVTSKTIEAKVGSSAAPATVAATNGIASGVPTGASTEVFFRSVAADRDLAATGLQVQVWSRALTDAEIDAVHAALDCRVASDSGLVTAPVPTVAAGETVSSATLSDRADPSRVWAVSGSGADLLASAV